MNSIKQFINETINFFLVLWQFVTEFPAWALFITVGLIAGYSAGNLTGFVVVLLIFSFMGMKILPVVVAVVVGFALWQ